MQTFGKYELVERIGTGGMAEIYLAKVTGIEGFERLLVVKKILPAYSRNRMFFRMLVDEAKMTSALQHPNIVQIYELGEVDGQPYIAMEYVHGKDLLKILARSVRVRRRMPLKLCLHVVAEACKALAYAHEARDIYGEPMHIVHRDVSPSNLIVSYQGEVKIMDFGVARARRQSHKSRSGVLKGKLGYMSPEQVLGRDDLDHRSDIFSLGILLFETITLKRLFLGKTDLETLVNIRDVRLEPRLARHTYLPEPVVAMIRKALAPDPAARYRRATELYDDIQDYLYEKRLRVRPQDLAAFVEELFDEATVLPILPRRPQTGPGEPGGEATGTEPSADAGLASDEIALDGLPFDTDPDVAEADVQAVRDAAAGAPAPEAPPGTAVGLPTAAPAAAATSADAAVDAAPVQADSEAAATAARRRAPTVPRLRALDGSGWNVNTGELQPPWQTRGGAARTLREALHPPGGDAAAGADAAGGVPAAAPAVAPAAEPEPEPEPAPETPPAPTAPPATGATPGAARATAPQPGAGAPRGPARAREGADATATHEAVLPVDAETLEALSRSTFRLQDSVGKVFGPITFSNLAALLRSRVCTESELISVDGGQWRPVPDIRGVADVSAALLPPESAVPAYTGLVAHIDVPRVLVNCWHERATGKLKFSHISTRKEIYFVHGRPNYIASSLKEELLGSFLVSRKLITTEQLQVAIQRITRTGERLGDMLVALNYLAAPQLHQALELLHRRKILQVFAWNGGQYEFFEGAMAPRGVVPLDIDLPRLLAEGIREYYGFEELKAYFRTRYPLILRLSDPSPEGMASQDLRLSGLERRFLSLVRPGRTLLDTLRLHAKLNKDALILFRVLFILELMHFVQFDEPSP